MKKRFFGFLSLLSVLCAGVISAIQSDPIVTNAESAPTSFSFEGETDADRSELSFTLTGSSLSETSQSFSLTIKSAKTETWSNGARYNDVFSRIDDESFVDFATAKEKALADYDAAKQNGTEYTPAVYQGKVFNIAYKKNKTIVLPQYVNYGSDPTYFRIHVTGIDPNACYDYKKKAMNYDNIESIVIPDGYEEIATDAFPGAKAANVVIKTTATTALPGWDAGWTDADVEYGYALTKDDLKRVDVGASGGSTLFGESKDFFVGYIDSKDASKSRPLVMEYSLLDANNAVVQEHLYYEVPLNNTQANYDAVGSTAGKGKDDRNIDIEVPKGTHVDESSIVFHNIYRLVKNSSGAVEPDWTSGPLKAAPTRSYSKVSHIGDFIDVTPGMACYLTNYSRFSIVVNAKYEVFKIVNPSSYQANKENIANGTLRTRILMSSLATAYYRVVYLDSANAEKTAIVPLKTPIGVTEIRDGASIGFLIKNSDVGRDFSLDRLVSLRLCNFYLQTDLFNTTKNTIASNSKKSVRFSSLELIPNGITSVKKVSIGAYFGICYGAYVLLFAIGSLLYWFYCKKKYKNDEFRRVDDKKFTLRCLRNLVGYGLILSSLLFIVARWALLQNTIVVFNPMDVWVIVFTIAGAIFFGIAIKDMVVSIKERAERKKKEKLHLDADVAEDGTN